jgi:hypothetical protein
MDICTCAIGGHRPDALVDGGHYQPAIYYDDILIYNPSSNTYRQSSLRLPDRYTGIGATVIYDRYLIIAGTSRV